MTDHPTIFEHEDQDGDTLTVTEGQVSVVFEAKTWDDSAYAFITATVAVHPNELDNLINALIKAADHLKEA